MGGDETSRRAYERGEAAAHVDVQPKRNFGVRQREHDQVIEADNLYADRRDVPSQRFETAPLD